MAITDLLERIDKYTEKLKELKTELKDELEATPMYKSIYDATLASINDNGFVVSEKDAAAHAYKITLKNYKRVN
mgnify:CR=1 FL=1